MSDVIKFTGNIVNHSPVTSELTERLHDVIREYSGQITFVEMLGALKVLELLVIEEQHENIIE